MKIGILLINNDPSYRGGVNSFINGLLSGLKRVDKKNEYYLLICGVDEKFHRKQVSKRFKIKTFSNWNKAALNFRYFLLKTLTAPLLRNFYYLVERLIYSKLIREINSLELDIIYSPSMPFFPLKLRGKLAISPHDIQHLHFPKYFSVNEKWFRSTVFPASMKSASVIQASTEFMKNDFHKKMNMPLEKIVVIPEGVSSDFLNFKPKKKNNADFLQKYKLKPGYLFYPAQHWPHKNHVTLLKAVKFLQRKEKIQMQVVFTGQMNSQFDSLYKFVKDNNLKKNVHFLGNIKYNELFYAYINAASVIVPVEYESSSLPVKEAMALGVPVIASRNGANEEINISNNILLFDTHDYKKLAEKILLLKGNPNLRLELVKKSKKIIKNYSWNSIAKTYISTFEQIYQDRIGSIFIDPIWRMGFDQLYKKGDHWSEEEQGKRFQLASKYMKGNGKKILDVGCGLGVLFDYVKPGSELFGIDISKEAIKLAKKRNPKADFRVGSASKLPYKNNIFDQVYCLEVLYYLRDDTDAFNEIYRVVKENGEVVIGLTLGGNYYDYDSVMNKIRSRFKILHEEFILPLRVLPKLAYKWKRISLFFYKNLPKGLEVKVYVYAKKV